MTNNNWFFIWRARPYWLTSIPSWNKPNIISFAFAAGRMLLLTAITLLALYPVFRAFHPDGFRFNAVEQYFLAAIFIYFEEHARWNFTLNADNKLRAALLFAICISFAELAAGFFNFSGSLGIAGILELRVVPTLLHFTLGLTAWQASKRSRPVAALMFLFAVILHVAYNKLGFPFLGG